MGINEVSVNEHKHFDAKSLLSSGHLKTSPIFPQLAHFLILAIAILLCEHISPFGYTHERHHFKSFDGRLHLTRAPRIGGSATLVLSIHSNLADSVHARILFHLPRGIDAESPNQFHDVYFPPKEAEQQYSVRLRVKKTGNFPLQASIYTTSVDGKRIAQHFYTYLLVTPTRAEIGSEPFKDEVGSFPLQTHAQLSSAPAEIDGALLIRGTVSYFDDNELSVLPVQKPQIQLYLEDQITGDIIIDHTVGDGEGQLQLQ